MVRTRGCRPSICRETMSWSAWTISAATGMGSSPMWGCAPWTVLPSTSMRKVSEEAKIGPSLQPAWPTDTQLPTCRPKTASTFGSSSAPSFTMSAAPPSSPSGAPSSAGWKRKTTVPGRSRLQPGEHLGRAEQDRRVGVVAAGVHDALRLAAERQVVRLLDRAARPCRRAARRRPRAGRPGGSPRRPSSPRGSAPRARGRGSRSATRRPVRSSRLLSSGWACRSRRTATTAGVIRSAAARISASGAATAAASRGRGGEEARASSIEGLQGRL